MTLLLAAAVLPGSRGAGSAAAAGVQSLPIEADPAALAAELLANPGLFESILQPLSSALAAAGPETDVPDYLAALSRAAARQVAATGPPWSTRQLDLLLTILLVHPGRFGLDAEFRQRVAAILPQAMDLSTPQAFRDALLMELNRVDGVDFDISERTEVGWHAARRASAARERPFERGHLHFADEGTIAASLFSLPSPYVNPQEAGRLLDAVRALAPEREILVLTDGPVAEALAGRDEHTWLLDTHGRPYTPWPRDPLLFARTSEGRVVLVERPNQQPRREADAFMARETIQQLPDALDQAWGGATWTTSPIPFHNGQLLLLDNAVWLSMHSLEIQTLRYLGADQIPVASFTTEAGVDRYLVAESAAAHDVDRLFQRQVRFVHPLPLSGELPLRREVLLRLGGGGGFDLDSLVTILPGNGGRRPVALVGDPQAGAEVLAGALDAEARPFFDSYRLAGESAQIRAAIAQYAGTTSARALDEFLEIIAAHMLDEGMEVLRLPLLQVPTSLRVDREALSHADFLVTWNNVVVETTPLRRRAEGFASLLESGDRRARETFAAAGYELALLPPLIESIVRNGGYRCASNHLRAW